MTEDVPAKRSPRKSLPPDTAVRRVIRALPPFAGLSPEVQAALAAAARVHRYAKDALVFGEGALPDAAHIVVRGTVELSKLEGGADCGIMLCSRGDILALGAVLGGEPFLASARTLGPARILAIPAEAFRAQVRAHPELSERLLVIMAGQWRTAVRHIIDLKCRSAAQRAGAFFLRLLDDQGTTPDRGYLHVPKSRVAARLGISPETLSRTIQILAEHGLVVQGARIRLVDRGRVERFCGMAPLPETEAGLGVQAL